jgi:hypothetical protein
MLEFAELKQVYETITKAIGKGQEPKAELLTVARFLNDLGAHEGIALEPKEEPDKEGAAQDTAAVADEKQPFTEAQLKFILEDLSPGLIKRMCRERSSDAQVSLEARGPRPLA